MSCGWRRGVESCCRGAEGCCSGDWMSTIACHQLSHNKYCLSPPLHVLPVIRLYQCCIFMVFVRPLAASCLCYRTFLYFFSFLSKMTCVPYTSNRVFVTPFLCFYPSLSRAPGASLKSSKYWHVDRRPTQAARLRSFTCALLVRKHAFMILNSK